MTTKAEREYRSCIGSKESVELSESEILDCKQKTFLSFMDGVLDFEREYLTKALNKFA